MVITFLSLTGCAAFQPSSLSVVPPKYESYQSNISPSQSNPEKGDKQSNVGNQIQSETHIRPMNLKASRQLAETDYRRSSLCSFLIRHPEKKYDSDIAEVFPNIPVPEKYNDHNLSKRIINAAMRNRRKSYKGEKNIEKTIEPFIESDAIARQLVSKWFDRDSLGRFDMELVKERGLYDADYFDEQIASQSIRGRSLLADAGEDLIGNTFVIFNDITYLDKEEAATWASVGVGIGNAIVGSIPGVGTVAKTIVKTSSESIKELNKGIGGFRVTVTSYLYRLRWDEETAGTFYTQYYTSNGNDSMKTAYESERGVFHLDYVGSYSASSSKTTYHLKGDKDQHSVIKLVCGRAIDNNIAQLQKEYEEFRVKTPLFSTEPLTAKIGLKEDIDEKSKFEVLEIMEDSDGRTKYKRVGVIRPVKDKIWDNRFMAEFEEENEGNTLTATEFEVVSGAGFRPGMLLREI